MNSPEEALSAAAEKAFCLRRPPEFLGFADSPQATMGRPPGFKDLGLRPFSVRLDMPKEKETTDAVDILHRRYFEGRPERLVELEEARASAEVARQIHELRTQAGLTQRELASLVGTSHSVISRLEDDDYRGHSLAMLRRIAAALGQRVEIRFLPLLNAQIA